MLDPRLCGRATIAAALVVVVVVGSGAWSRADDAEIPETLSLADLTAYRRALADTKADDGAGPRQSAPVVSFPMLWNRPDAFRGRRVTVEGRIERIFRQGPVGSFPALAEIWIVSPAGDPFCLVAPRENSKSVAVANPGTTVRFTGTFLKMVRYAAGDGARLAPLVVGAHLPAAPALKTASKRDGGQSPNDGGDAWAAPAPPPPGWTLGLTCALLAAGAALGWRRLYASHRNPGPRSQRRRQGRFQPPDPPLEFVEPVDLPD